MTHRHLIVLAALAALTLPSLALANARLISVVPTDGGCVSGPTGPGVQAWDVEPGKTYEVTISNVTECANGGTDPTLNVRVNSMNTGNTDIVATLVARFIGIANPIPSLPVLPDTIAEFTPMTLPSVSNVGPPELPLFTGASI